MFEVRTYRIRKFLHGNKVSNDSEIVSCIDIAKYMRDNYDAVILCGSTNKICGEFLVFQSSDLKTHYKVGYALPKDRNVYNFIDNCS